MKPRSPDLCVHFNGIQNDACKAGVHYHALTGGGVGCALRLPCVRPFPGQQQVEKVTCEKQRPETGAEFTAREAETDRRIAEMLGVNKAVHDFEEANGGPRVGEQRVMPCPVCGCSTLGIFRIPTRLYVTCTTPKCVRYEANLGGSVFDTP
jgi:hypothetical protein